MPISMKPGHQLVIWKLRRNTFYAAQQMLFEGRSNDLWEMAEALSAYGCDFVVIKRGERGQLLYDASSKARWEIPAYPARLANPTGVGDAFCGGFLAGYRRAYDPLEAVLHGNVSSSIDICLISFQLKI